MTRSVQHEVAVKTNMMPLYREYPPHPALVPYVQCYWSIAPAPSVLINHVLPDGCVDVMFTLHDEGCIAEVVGTMQSAINATVNDTTAFLGVRFLPGGALPFLRLPLYELTDSALPLEALWGSLARELSERIFDAPTLPAKIKLLENVLLQRINAPVDTLILETLYAIRSRCGSISIHELTTRAALSERQLERRFRQHIGLSPKMFARVVRFRSAAALLQQPAPLSLQDVVFRSGYYDQAHFIHDFKAFTGLTPTEYQAQQRDVGFLQYTLRLP
jgi:AraC-like DNA-binding protein